MLIFVLLKSSGLVKCWPPAKYCGYRSPIAFTDVDNQLIDQANSIVIEVVAFKNDVSKQKFDETEKYGRGASRYFGWDPLVVAVGGAWFL